MIDIIKKLEDDWEPNGDYWEKVESYCSRREDLGRRMNRLKLECPECNTRQVQLVKYMDTYPAQWKCRHCKHKFEWEGDGYDHNKLFNESKIKS